MPFAEISSGQIESLVGTMHEVTEIEYPPRGLQPYYEWIIRTLDRLADASFGALRAGQSDQSATSIHIAPGRVSIADNVLAFAGEDVELAQFNNDVAYIWIEDDAGVATIGVNDDATGWPAGNHLPLAEVTIVAGEITQIIDRRIDHVFKV